MLEAMESDSQGMGSDRQGSVHGLPRQARGRPLARHITPLDILSLEEALARMVRMNKARARRLHTAGRLFPEGESRELLQDLRLNVPEHQAPPVSELRGIVVNVVRKELLLDPSEPMVTSDADLLHRELRRWRRPQVRARRPTTANR